MVRVERGSRRPSDWSSVSCARVIQDGLGTGDTLEVSRRRITNGKNALNDNGVEARRRMGSCTRTAVKDVVIIGWDTTEALAPFFDPGKRAMGRSRVVSRGPGRLELEQGAEKSPVGEPVVFHRATSTL